MPVIETRQALVAPIESVEFPLLRKIYQYRGVANEAHLSLAAKDLLHYSTLKDIDVAANRIASAIENQEKIVVVGDFDADGATSTALSVFVMNQFGADVDFVVPNRFEFGYGLSPQIVDVVARKKPSVIFTVDNGIASIEGVQRANQLGIDVVVTDHHLAGDELPEAFAMVNPNQPGCEFESKAACGCAVAFYVMAAIRKTLIDRGIKQADQLMNLADRLDLVALATIADVVPLDKNNRILVNQGLNRIRKGKALPGILALIEVAGKDAAGLCSSDMGFAIGPRLNAAGRLDDMSLGINCLLAKDMSVARDIAAQLNDLNIERRNIEKSMQVQAMAFLEKIETKNVPLGLCLFQDDWHEGVIGILASRIKDKFNRPVIAFAPAEGGMIKGSARSIEGFHIRDGLDLVAKKYPELLSKFGGHAMAAGLSIKAEDLDAFSAAFNEQVSIAFNHKSPVATILTDGELSIDQFNLENANFLKRVMPWGQLFPEPCFEGVFNIVEQRIVGSNHLKLKLSPMGETMIFDAISFNVDLNIWPSEILLAKAVFKLDINEFRGDINLQLLVDYIEPVKE